MKVTVKANELLRYAHLAAAIADKRSPVETLRSVHLEVPRPATELTVTAVEMSTALCAAVLAEDAKAEPGAALVDAAAFHAAVKSIGGYDVTLSTTPGKRLVIQSGKSRIEIPGGDPKHFSSVPIHRAALHKIDGALLARTLRRTVYAVSHDTARPNISSTIVESDGKTLRTFGLDGHRLAEQKIPTTLPAFGVAIPRVATERLIAFLADGDAAAIGVDGDRFVCTVGRATMYIRATLPGALDFESHYQLSSRDNIVTVGREELLRAAKLAALVSSNDSEESLDAFQLSAEDNEFRVANDNATKGAASAVVPMDEPAQKAVSVRLTWRYLVESLSLMDSDDVRISFNGNLEPIVLSPVGQEGQQHLIMIRDNRGSQ